MRIKARLQRFLPYLLIMMFAVLMLWPQIHSHAFFSGYDYYFHMSRTYETAMQIKTGHFSYFLSLFSWNHNARIINALYGPLGGYFSGLILLISRSWLHWEISMSWLTLTLAGTTMYDLGRYWHVNRYLNFSLSGLYMLSEPVSDYVFNQMFAGIGAALLPLLVLLMSQIMVQKDVRSVKLALILVLIVEIHLMTFILSMIFVIPCLLITVILARRTRDQLFKHLVKGIGLMLILSFNVWGSILEVFGSNFHHIIPTFPGTNLGNKSYSAILNTYPKTTLIQSPSLIGMGVAILIVVTVILWLINWRRLSNVTNVLMFMGLFSIWISSGYFPWGLTKQHFVSFTTLIQFPKRFLPLGLILIYLSFGVILSQDLKRDGSRRIGKIGLIFLLCLISWGWHHNYDMYQNYIATYNKRVINWHHYVDMHWQNRYSPNQLRNSLRSNRPGQFLDQVDSPVPDYLPTNVTYRRSSQYRILNPQSRYQRTYLHRIHFKWVPLGHGREMITVPLRQGDTITLPFAKYAHTKVDFNGHAISPKVNRVGAMRLRLHNGRNHVTIQYRPAIWFRSGMLISILIWILMTSYVIYRKFNESY